MLVKISRYILMRRNMNWWESRFWRIQWSI